MFRKKFKALLPLPLLLLAPPLASSQQKPSSTRLSAFDAASVHSMLREALADVRKFYYDPAFHHVDLEKNFRTFDARIDSASSLGEALRLVAAFLGELHDSHVFFSPPSRLARYDAGYRLQIIGEHCLITHIRPGSEAAAKLRVGDQVLSLDGYKVNRSDLSDLRYFLDVLAPGRPESLLVGSVDGSTKTVIIHPLAKLPNYELQRQGAALDDVLQWESEEHRYRNRLVELGPVLLWKFAGFEADRDEIDKVYRIASRHKVLVIDLRENGGGYVDTVQRIVGHLFDHDVQIAQRIGRKEHKPQVAQGNHHPFTGRVIVLIDSGSASGSELLARVVQLQNRGTVLGDISAGAVMEARHYEAGVGAENTLRYSFSITDADLVMLDGKSLEHVGVTPDERILPSAEDLAAGRDPVLARALELAEVPTDPTAAGKLLPYEWLRF